MQVKGAGGTPEFIAFAATAALLVIAMIFGGGSRGAGDLVVHLFALLALALGILRWRHADATRLQRLFLYLLLTAMALVALQLLPLPASLFARLPQRVAVLADMHAAGVAPAWLPMTLDRWGTVRALLALITFAAMWMLASTLATHSRQRLIQLAVVLAVPMVLLGFAQVPGGSRIDLHVHDFQNKGSATALFANRNHLAALLAMLAPLAMVFGHQAQQQRRVPAAFAWYGALMLLLLGAAMTFSRAGILLATLGVAITAAILLLRGNSPVATWPRRHAGLFAATLVTILAVANYAWGRIIDRFNMDPLGDRRWEYLEHGWSAIKAYLPWGSGMGSFRDTYAPFEPVSAMVNTHALHAHNDFVEVALEAGILGLLLIALAIPLLAAIIRNALVGATSVAITLPVATHPRFHPHTLAITTAILIPIAHSLVDYPLRTLTITTLFALLLAHLGPQTKPNDQTD
ncbi:O-antigen ligase family protein [Lysobacter sp. F6437]|uniref:O-antigen ligase family protein n=1 Tax=Lysobacter sp. F6437 TaxID=3459296 RepID=UPI00403D5AA2